MLHRLAGALGIESGPLQDLFDPRLGFGLGHAVELRAVKQVLGRRQLLEEAGLDAYAVHHALGRTRILERIDAEDRHRALIRLDQGREDADQRALAAAVWAQQTDDLADVYRQ